MFCFTSQSKYNFKSFAGISLHSGVLRLTFYPLGEVMSMLQYNGMRNDEWEREEREIESYEFIFSWMRFFLAFWSDTQENCEEEP